MQVDWTLFARWAAPIAALFVGAALTRILERRPKLISYLAHASAVSTQALGDKVFVVHTHSVVVRNAGRLAAQNVRLGHNILPNFSVFPAIRYEVLDLPAGAKELLFPTLVPDEQVTVTYLYYPPLLWSAVNSYAKSDAGFAKILQVLPTPQPSPWIRRLLLVLVVVGASTIIYGMSELLRYLF